MNSGIVGSIFAGYIGLRAVVSIAAVHRRLPDGSRETRLDTVQPSMLPLLAGSKVLVLICCNDSGTSLNRVVSALQDLGKDAPAELRTAALYTTISPAIFPNYRAVVVGRDTRRSMNQIISHLPWNGPRLAAHAGGGTQPASLDLGPSPGSSPGALIATNSHPINQKTALTPRFPR